MPVLLPLQRENFLFSLLKSPLPKLTCNRIQEYREESGYREVMIKDYFLDFSLSAFDRSHGELFRCGKGKLERNDPVRRMFSDEMEHSSRKNLHRS